jgi:hypothetical protein
MTVLYGALIGLGCLLCIVAVAWSIRTRHERKVWRSTRHDTSTAAIVLELEERVLELEERVQMLTRRSTSVR